MAFVVPAKVNVNMRTVVHQASNGIAMGFPDVCKTPSPVGPIPIPYPNIAMSVTPPLGDDDKIVAITADRVRQVWSQAAK